MVIFCALYKVTSGIRHLIKALNGLWENMTCNVVQMKPSTMTRPLSLFQKPVKLVAKLMLLNVCKNHSH